MDDFDVIDQRIAEMRRRIVKRFNPEKLILFGSYAHGDASLGSDADLLVVMPVKNSMREVATAIDCELFGINLAADVIVVSPETAIKALPQTVVGTAMREGTTLYERA